MWGMNYIKGLRLEPEPSEGAIVVGQWKGAHVDLRDSSRQREVDELDIWFRGRVDRTW